MTRICLSAGIVILLGLFAAGPARAQSPAAATGPADEDVSDLQLVPGEPDFSLTVLPTSLRMPSHRFAFRLTHRFTRPLTSGTAGELASDLFGLDSSAHVGLELRYGVRSGTQVAVHRTNDRAIQLLGQQQIVRARAAGGLGADAVVAVEGANNFRERYATTLGGIVSRRFGESAAVYAEPFVVLHANALVTAGQPDEHTVMIGVGARVRLGRSRTYLVVDAAPRLAGYRPGTSQVSVGIEKRVGGHMFQLNVSNALGTTLAQVARGGPDTNDWFMGFNLTRRLF